MRIQWPGKSGRIYDCELQPINTWFKEDGGVYIICKPVDAERWDGLEIGETENLRDSITSRVTDILGRHPSATHVAVIMHGPAFAKDTLADLLF